MNAPRSLQLAAAAVAVQGAGMVVAGAVAIVRALSGRPHDRGTAVLLGVLVLVYASGVLTVGRGLWRVRPWAQTPTYLVQFFAIVVAIGQLHTLAELMVPLIVVAVVALVAVSAPASRAVLARG